MLFPDRVEGLAGSSQAAVGRGTGEQASIGTARDRLVGYGFQSILELERRISGGRGNGARGGAAWLSSSG